MRKYEDSDYAVNKFSPNIVYRFADDTRSGKRKNTLGSIEESARFATAALDEKLIQNNDERSAIAAAMLLLESGDLTEIQRRRFMLHFFQGLSYRRTAQHENVHFTSVQESIEAANAG